MSKEQNQIPALNVGPRASRQGSALLMTVLTVALLLVIVVTFTIQVQMDMKAARNDLEMAKARANARLAVELAIARLQETAGPDQRVTAVADILDGTDAPATGRSHWTGVWNTENFNPSQPDTRPFVRWLVSSPSESGGTQLSHAKDPTSVPEVTIFEGLDAASSVNVPRVDLDATGGKTNSFAFWVEDEGLKADLSWNEGEFEDEERAQAARLSAAPGVDYAVFNGGPFDDQVTYPIEESGPGNAWLDRLDRATTPDDMPLVFSDLADHEDWLQDARHHVTLRSRGVLADVKNGGLRRDLSLAFEMDGEEEAENATRFNQQEGEFVGGSDKYASPHDCPGMPVRERYLFRETADTGGPFSNLMQRPNDESHRDKSVTRGPTWWLLRDYYNLYKRLEGSGGSYKFDARAYYPDRDAIGHSFSDKLDTIVRWADHWDTDRRLPLQGMFNGQWQYLFRPARASYAPVNLGAISIISVMTTNFRAADQTAEVAIAIDPIFYLWNPYNRQIEVENVAVYFETGMPGNINLAVTEGTNTTQNIEVGLWALLNANMDNHAAQSRYWGNSFSFLIKDPSGAPLVLEPGEVVAASPTTSGTGESFLGYDPLDNGSGIIANDIIVSGGGLNLSGSPLRVRVSPGTTRINVGYSDPTSSGANSPRFFMETNLAPPGATGASLANSRQILGNQTQSTHMQLTAVRREYIAQDDALFNPGAELDANTLLNTKWQFGLFTYLMKPAFWSGNGANPVEVFSRFNPAPMVISKDWWAAAVPNMVFNFVASSSPNSLINGNGINFSASPRNAFWGSSYDSSGSSFLPMANIPASPLLSLVDFSDANLGTMASDQFHAVGNSWASAIIPPIAPYGRVNISGGGNKIHTGTDLSWHCNDILFDRYFFSGLVPEFTINSGGYSRSGTLEDPITDFYGADHRDAMASPVLRPHVPEDTTSEAIVSALNPTSSVLDGYRKVAAYSLLEGAFNINSTSQPAWEAFLRSNRGLDVDYAQDTGTDSDAGTTPFPGSPAPSAPGVANQYWSGLARLTDAEIANLAQNLVTQIRTRGPFMSIGDFVNRRVGGTSVTPEHHKGAVQTAIDDANLNADVRSGAGGTTPNYGLFPLTPGVNPGSNRTTTGIPSELTQADILRPLAPRLSARSDTFRIRAVGEVRGADGDVSSSAVCEVVVQRIPEYVEASANEPWDEAAVVSISPANQSLGRRFKPVGFRWLTPEDL